MGVDYIPLVLGSASPARLQVLRAAGIEPTVIVSEVDEDRVVSDLWRTGQPAKVDEVARHQVCALAAAKAGAVAAKAGAQLADAGDTALVVGCDSMLEIGEKVVGKPHQPQVARERLLAMSEQAGVLWTGHSLLRLEREPGEGSTEGPATGNSTGDPAGGAVSTWKITAQVTHAARTVVYFGRFDPEIVDAYVATGEPLKVAGAFTIDGIGGPLVAGVEGDPHSVVGLSLPLLRELLDQVGVPLPWLWNLEPARQGNPLAR